MIVYVVDSYRGIQKMIFGLDDNKNDFNTASRIISKTLNIKSGIISNIRKILFYKKIYSIKKLYDECVGTNAAEFGFSVIDGAVNKKDWNAFMYLDLGSMGFIKFSTESITIDLYTDKTYYLAPSILKQVRKRKIPIKLNYTEYNNFQPVEYKKWQLNVAKKIIEKGITFTEILQTKKNSAKITWEDLEKCWDRNPANFAAYLNFYKINKFSV